MIRRFIVLHFQEFHWLGPAWAPWCSRGAAALGVVIASDVVACGLPFLRQLHLGFTPALLFFSTFFSLSKVCVRISNTALAGVMSLPAAAWGRYAPRHGDGVCIGR